MNKQLFPIAGILFPLLFVLACASGTVNTEPAAPDREKSFVPPARYLNEQCAVLWEGNVDGRPVALFRNQDSKDMIIVVTQDELPGYYKRIEYLDRDSDGGLDSVHMQVFEKVRGWRDIGISRENETAMEYASGRYSELMRKIEGSPDFTPADQ